MGLSNSFFISEDQARYITNAQAGSGLLQYAGTLIPFVNRFKKDTELYRLITTKPGEVQKAHPAKYAGWVWFAVRCGER